MVVFGWFDTITNFGLNLLLTREVSRDRSTAAHYLLNSSVLRLALAGIGVPFLLLFLLIQHPNQTAILAILLLYIGLVPNSISYGLTALFYAFEKAEIPAAISTLSAIMKVTFGLGVLLIGWGVIGLAASSIAINVVTLIVLWWQARGLLAEHAKISPPKPTAIGNLLCLRSRFTSCCASPLISLRAPVTPNRDTA